MQNMSVDNFLNKLSYSIGVQYTDEQREFMKDFTSPIISFSSPGTGKTRSAIGGLLTAEFYHQIPGSQIYALSFTNMATTELAIRHKKDCETLGVHQTVNFQTFHSLCKKVLMEHHRLLGIRELRIADQLSIETQAPTLQNFADEHGIHLMPWQVRPFINAVRNLNSSLVFDRLHVESKYLFKKCKMTYEDFTKMRKFLYLYTKMTSTIQVQDIPIYALELLLTHPEVSEEFKKNCRILLVDEFQDLSLLQLRVISLLSDTVIAIGDIKQQIYAFNGACQEIVTEFKRYFPHARELNLNKSFRCAESIVRYSKMIIHPNDMKEEDFIGTGEEGTLAVTKQLSLPDICDQIETEYRENRNTFKTDVMFLFRNNYSAIPIAEELYRRKVPFRVNKYKEANLIPVIREMCAVIELALHPNNPANIEALRYILPEQRQYKLYTDSPIYKVCITEGCSVLEAPYQFKDAMAARRAMELLLELEEMLGKHKPMRDLLNVIYPVFNAAYLSEREPYLEAPPSYYFNMVREMVQEKTYTTFISDEIKKAQVIQDATIRRHGVRCYTFHAAKGLEADDVYILDAEDTIIPNTKKLDQLEEAHCILEKARELRNERSLLFVAATRAKHKLVITYNAAKSLLLAPYNVFERYDDLYTQSRDIYPDVEAFEEFFKGGL